MNTPPLPGILMGILAFVSLIIFFIYLRRALALTGWTKTLQNRIYFFTIFFTTAWLVLTGILAEQGFFADFSVMPPRPVLAIFIPLPIILALALSKKSRIILLATPAYWLIIFQSFRVFVELILWLGFLEGMIPWQMSFEGRNWDILTGIISIPIAWAVMQRVKGYRTWILLFNITGMITLINVLAVALLSMPTPLRYFNNEPSLEKIAGFPMIYLPAVLVVLAYSFHIFSLRRLWLRRKSRKPHFSDIRKITSEGLPGQDSIA
jgi:hypothetical protein